jgi:predicted kinase
MQASIVIITGHPGSGKTGVAKRLARQYRIPLVSKDALKERIFDSVSVGDKQWSLKVSGAAHRIMDDMAEELLKAGRSVILESNFKAGIDSERFRILAEKYHVGCTQILCSAPGAVLFQRWNDRIANSERHEGHVEEVDLEQLHRDLELPYQPLDLSGSLVILDTTDFSSLQLPELK